jgi:hypothetical protein
MRLGSVSEKELLPEGQISAKAKSVPLSLLLTTYSFSSTMY